MSLTCEITAKTKLKGNRVSHANNKTRHFQKPNIQEKRMFIPELGLFYSLKASTRGLRTVDKFGGLSQYVLQHDAEKLSAGLKRLRKALVKKFQ